MSEDGQICTRIGGTAAGPLNSANIEDLDHFPKMQQPCYRDIPVYCDEDLSA